MVGGSALLYDEERGALSEVDFLGLKGAAPLPL